MLIGFLYSRWRIAPVEIINQLIADSKDFGISIVPENTKINLKGVKSISISDLDWQNTVYMAYLKSSYEIPVIGEFKAFIKENAINL